MPHASCNSISKPIISIIHRYSLLAFWALASIAQAQVNIPAEPTLEDIYAIFPDAQNQLEPQVAAFNSVIGAFVTAFGFTADHRAYEPATPLGNSFGLSLGLEFTLMSVPQSFFDSFSEYGVALPDTVRALPMPRIVAHKGIGERFDIGASYFAYTKYTLMGGDAKLVLIHGDDVPTIAARMNGTWATLDFISLQIYSLQVIMSRKMDSFDPYIGASYTWCSGSAGVAVPLPAPLNDRNVKVTATGSDSAFNFIGGLAMRFVPIGLQFVIEGSLQSQGYHTVGFKFGIQM